MGKSTCSVEGCDRSLKGHGYCNLHYQRFKRYGHPGEAKPRLVKTHRNIGPCTVDGCAEPRFCKGLCTLHYSRMRGHGTPEYVPAKRTKTALLPLTCHWDGCTEQSARRIFCDAHGQMWDAAHPYKRTDPIEARIAARILKVGDCWYYTGPLHNGYYARISYEGREQMAHRVTWRLANNAEIPEGMQIDHFCCWTHYCINPEHLRPATQLENIHNRHTPNRGNESGYKGVTWYAQGKNWNARYDLDGETYNLGFFDDKHEAYRTLEAHRREQYAARGWDFDGQTNRQDTTA